jgi:hypothetical protein
LTIKNIAPKATFPEHRQSLRISTLRQSPA